MIKLMDSLACINKPKDFLHPFFGMLKFSKRKYRRQWFWNGSVVFEDQLIALRIFSGKGYPIDDQVEFFKKTMINQHVIVEKSSKYIKHNFESWTKKNYFTDFLNEFNCIKLDIPMKGKEKNDWQITFAHRTDNDFVVTVYFVNNEVESTDLD